MLQVSSNDRREQLSGPSKSGEGGGSAQKTKRNLPPRRDPPTGLPMTSSYKSSGLQTPQILRKNSCDSVQPFYTSRQVETASSKVWSMPIIALPYKDAPETPKTENNLLFLRDTPLQPPMSSSYLSSGRQAPHSRLQKDSNDSVKLFHTGSQVAIPSISLACKDAPQVQELERDSLCLHLKTSTAQEDPSQILREEASDYEEDLARRVVDFVLSNEKTGKRETSGAKAEDDVPPKHKTKRTPPPPPQMTPYISSGVRAPYRVKQEDSSDDEDEAGIQTVWHIHPRKEGDEALGPSRMIP